MPKFHWLLLIAIIAVIFAFGTARGAEYGDPGVLMADTHLCEATSISPVAVERYEGHRTIIERMIEVGIENLTPEEHATGYHYTQEVECGTLAEDYNVRIYWTTDKYALIVFAYEYDFDPIFHIIRLEDFIPGVPL